MNLTLRYRTEQKAGEFIITFPEVYHSGFSTGWNLAEACNVASASWLEAGERSYSIFRKTKEKIPVFSLEWLVVENIRHFEYIKLDKETWKKIWKIFVKQINNEKRFRQENEIVQIKRGVSGENPCQYCTDLCYLSYIHCPRHEEQYCISHGIQCECSKEEVTLVYKYTIAELESMFRNFKKTAYLAGSKFGQEYDAESVELQDS